MFLVVVRLGSVAHCLGVAQRFADQLRDLEDLFLIAEGGTQRSGYGFQAAAVKRKPESPLLVPEDVPRSVRRIACGDDSADYDAGDNVAPSRASRHAALWNVAPGRPALFQLTFQTVAPERSRS